MMPTSSISAGARVPHGMGDRPPLDARHHPLPRVRREQLGVTDALRRGAAGLVDDDDADGDRAGERATADLVHAREHPVAVALERALDAQARRAARPGGAHGPAPAVGTSAKVSAWSDSQVGAAERPHDARRPGR